MRRHLLAGLAALGLAPFGLGEPALAQPSLPAGPPIRIVAVTQPLPTQPQYTRVDRPFFLERMPQQTNGRIQVQLSSHAERNLSGTEIVRLVRSGQADIGGATLTTVSGDVPLLDGIDLAGLSPDIALAKRIAEAAIPAANRELERFGTRILFMYPFPAQVVFCRQPFERLTDLRGRKVRTFGNSLNEFFTTLGAQPVSIGFPEVYSALERGVVDCGITGSGSGAAARWPEVSTHVSDLPLSWAVSAYIANVAWWNRLSPEVRSYLEAVFAEMRDAQWELGAQATRDGLDCNIGRAAECRIHTVATRPMTEVRANDADRALVRQILEQTVLPGYVRRVGPRAGEFYNATIAPLTGVRVGN